VGEAGGKKVAEIDEAFSRLGLDGLGALTDKPVDPAMSLTGQTILKGDPGFRVSAATNQKYTARKTDSLSRDMADYLYNLYRARKETFRYLALTYAEADADNPRIEEIAQDLTGRFSDLDISVPMLALPGVAHTGIEAVMSHPESFFNIAIVYTDTYGDSFNGLGRQEVVKGVSVDTRTYGYAVGNIHRASLAGIPTILFELKDKERLPEAQAIISDAMRMFRERIDKGDGGDGNDKKTAPASAKDTPGGVAFQDLAATELAAASPATGKGTVRVSARELDAQWKEIRLELVKGNAPYPEIKKFVAACSGRDDARLRLKAAVTCIDEILKKQAEECVPSEGALVEILRQLG
jgi:hypothetical protein